MRRVRLAALLVPVLITPGCASEEPKPAEQAPPAPIAALPVAPPPVDVELRRAVQNVYSVWCASAMCEDGFKADAALVERAGAGVLPVLAALVADEDAHRRLVLNAAWVGTEYPLCVELRAALRARRDERRFGRDAYGPREDFFRYFVRFGDESDLAWMEKAVGELCEEDRPRGAERVRELRARLETN